jgi:hypothetical protein
MNLASLVAKSCPADQVMPSPKLGSQHAGGDHLNQIGISPGLMKGLHVWFGMEAAVPSSSMREKRSFDS